MIVKLKDMNSLKQRLILATLLLLAVVCMIGLSTAVSFAQGSYAIHSLATSRSYTATMQINDKAEDVWQSVVNVAKKRNPNNLKIKEENKKKLKFEAVKMTKSGEELWASLKVRPESETSCQLIFTATMGGNKPLAKDMKDMVTDILLQFCDEKGLTCKIVK
ncbi:MAG: hypothetical protein KAQ85_02410 [Thermodesulfovibrionia bacterium]|nr:hypothetical protein [Thermodesulfovibrionia bacterium]